MRLTVILPVLNEEKWMTEAQRRISAYLSLRYEDPEILYYSPQAFSCAKGNRILLTDARLRVPIKEVDKLVMALEKDGDVAVGYRRQSSFLGSKEVPCDFICFTPEAARKVFSEGTASTAVKDILGRAKHLSLRIAQVPVMWSDER